jgi:hypothetical protein
VITDIDPVQITEKGQGKKIRKAQAITASGDLECGNDTLSKWHPAFTQLKDFEGFPDTDKVWTSGKGSRVRFAWQVPVPSNGPWPSSFEDSFIHTNHEWFKARTSEKGAIGSAARRVEKHSDPKDLNEALHQLLRGSFNKGDFAATLFEHLCNGEPLRCPSYISDALAWLEQELQPSSGEDLI